MSEILGLWNTSWPKQGGDFPEHIKQRKKGHFKVSEKVLNYLANGCKIIAQRTLQVSVHDNKIIRYPDLRCDNLFVWSSEYAFYVGQGFIEVDPSLFENMQANDFIIPKLVFSDLENLNKLLLKSGFPKLTSIPPCP